MTLRLRLASLLCLTVIGCMAGPAPSDAKLELFVGGSSDIVISQLFGGGGNSGGQFTNDFVELFNRSSSAVAIDGWSVQYASATGTSWAKANLSGTIPAGGYYLIQLAAGSGTATSLPSPDATGPMNMSGTTGKVALVTNQTLLSCGGGAACLPNASIRDFVGYGTADNFEGSAAAPTASSSTAELRRAGGCTDNNTNSADFTTAAPAPRTSRSAHTTCAGATDAGVADAGSTPVDAAPSSGDGTPMRRACTNTFGAAMNTTFGRLDGFLVAVVGINGSSCRSDDNHVHLQVLMHNAVYDIAVNIASTSGNPDVDFLTVHAPLKGAAWSEGWHPSQQLDYVNDLGVHSGSFTETTPSQLASLVASDLASANHVSVFATGFDGTGGHLIHRQGSSHDGAIVINPLSASPQYLLFHFTTQSF
jgi:hypothetical protein